MDYIFKDWEKRMSAFESSVEKDLAEIRKCKADMQDMRRRMHEEMTGSYYVRDMNRIILSAPEIILGNVDTDGVLYEGAASKVIVRGTEVDLQATGNGGRVETRASSIRQIAEDPGTDGLEHVVLCPRWSVRRVASSSRAMMHKVPSLHRRPQTVACAFMPTSSWRSVQHRHQSARRSNWTSR